MIFIFAVAAIDFLKGFLIDVEDEFFKFSDYDTEEDAYDAAAAWVDQDGYRWNWDIGHILTSSIEIIKKIHDAVQHEYIREWATQGKFSIIIPGCNITIPIINEWVLQPLPEWMSTFSTEFCIKPLKSWLNDVGDVSDGYYVMRKRLAPYFNVPGTDTLLYTIDGVEDYGYNFDPPHYLSDRDLSVTLDKCATFAYWTNFVYHVLKSETAKRWVDSMINANAAYRRWAQLNKIDESLDNIEGMSQEVQIDLSEMERTLKEVSGKIGLKMLIR